MNSHRLLDAIEKTQQDLGELKEFLTQISKDRDDFAVFFSIPAFLSMCV
jgi:hypothetical protein